MTNWKVGLFAVLAILTLAIAPIGTAMAQDVSDNQVDENSDSSVLEGIEAAMAQSGAITQQAQAIDFPQLPAGYEPSEETLESIQRAVFGYYDYRARGYEHRSNVFQWQLTSSRIIFFVVIVIVAAGLYFSWMQFHASGNGTQMKDPTSLDLTTSGIKVTSPILGVIILVLSLAFFYLYLIYVYPIQEIL